MSWARVCAVILGCLLMAPAGARTVLGIVSERAAAEVAEAATQWQRQRPDDRIVLRTPQQLAEMDTPALQALLSQSDSVVAVAVFGEQGVRVREAARALQRKNAAPTLLLAFHSEADLSRGSYRQGESLREFSALELTQLAADGTPPPALAKRAANDPLARDWLAFRALWREGGSHNLQQALSWLADGGPVPAPQPQPERWLRQRGAVVEHVENDGRPVLAVLDLNTAEPHISDALCEQAEAQGLACVGLFARWGPASEQALRALPDQLAGQPLAGVVVLQDFVIGAAQARDAATQALTDLDVPVFKAVRMADRSEAQWRLSGDGLPAASVQYRVAMSELQGTSQPMVVAVAGTPRTDPVTGVRLRQPDPLIGEMQSLVARASRWRALRAKPAAERRIALIYYNHPPGRQNIGADNLDVPASLHHILGNMKGAGYRVEGLPATPTQLLDKMMRDGVNTPEDNGELAAIAHNAATLSAPGYARWFATLPDSVQSEVSDGPLGRLREQVVSARRLGEPALGAKAVDAAERELRHLLEGIRHPQRDAALLEFEHLIAAYRACLARIAQVEPLSCQEAEPRHRRLLAMHMPGLRGWGSAPGNVMVSGGRIVLPGVQLGHVFIGPQPPRGWEVEEELLHANTQIPPPHQYLAYYHWLRDVFKADAIVHVGRHSTYEFLPGKAVGLASDDYSRLIAGDVPGIYPYIVDGVGEGTQAKRRGLAVMIDHLTPPLSTTPLYDRLLTLRQLVESFESSSSEPMRAQAAAEMRKQVVALELRAELEASMGDVLKVRGIGFEQADDELLAHEIGHYLTKLQEKFMPHGLHVFGQDWQAESLDTMLTSMAGMGDAAQLRERLQASPAAEMRALLHALDGGFVVPGKGNDPLRAPESLPTGRNFHALDGDVLPTPLAQRLGAEQAERVLIHKGDADGSEGVVLWASDAVRDEGVMVGFSLALMGVAPTWNARGIVQGLELIPGRAGQRRDVMITTSGLFRDLYPNLVQLLDRGGRLALAASGKRLQREQPQLREALQAALAPLGEHVEWGDEPIAGNGVARQWLSRTRRLRASGVNVADAGKEAAWRIFGDAPGAYGAGVNRLTERSGSWTDREQIGRAYLARMGHAYGLDADGSAAHRAFELGVSDLARTYHGRASHLYGLLDNNDAFDYLGGLSLATETLTGRVPQASVLYNADASHAGIEPLQAALLREFRGRYLNPAWIKPLMNHGYAGARTISQEFLENLWGWQVTRPDVIRDWAWNEVQRVYLQDAHGLGVDRFLDTGHAQQAKAHMLALMLVAAQKGFWKTPDSNVEVLGRELARLVVRNGLPGSGHTAPDHPMWKWLQPRLQAPLGLALQRVLERARGEPVEPVAVQATAAATVHMATRRENAKAVNTTSKPVRPRAAEKPVPSPSPQAQPRKATPRVSELVPVPPAKALMRRHPVPSALVALLLLALVGLGLRRGIAPPRLAT